ncbi:MAG: hypothetical protein RL681_148 [Candidatus Parcubacteria bacterium]
MMQRKTESRTRPTDPHTAEPSLASVKLIACLGNPGDEYRRTYHNAGALFAEYIQRTATDAPQRTGHTALYTLFRLDTRWIVIPRTFMNESGRAVRAALSARHMHPEELLVAHDDSDIPLGEFKLAFGRGAAGHNGIASIIAALGTNRFWRLRIGIRHHPGKAGSFVLRPMSNAARETLYSVFGDAYKKLTVNEKP